MILRIYKTDRFCANDYARSFMSGRPTEHLRVRIKDKWAYLYCGHKRVWDCNEDFFRYHFYKQEVI